MQFVEIGRRRAPKDVGRPADALGWLASHGLRIPRSWLATSPSLDELDEGAPELITALDSIVRDQTTYTVRTSTQMPGQSEDDVAPAEEIERGVAGSREVARAIERVRTRAYARLNPPDDRPLSIERLREEPAPRAAVAVIIAEEPAADVSGVAFSSNPLTALDEVVIEAVRGPVLNLGRTDVGPDRWVRKWGAWRCRPTASDISTLVVSEVADRAAEAQRRLGWPVELDWVYDGEHVVFTDMRDLVSIETANFYSNLVAREFIPGVQPPLVWEVNVPIIVGAWMRLLTEMVGDTGLDVHDVARAYFYRAYFDMAALARLFDLAGLPRETLEMLVLGGGVDAPDAPRVRFTARSLVRAPRAIGFAATKVRLGAQVEHELPQLEQRLREFDAGADAADLTAHQVLARIDELLPIVEDAAYLNAVTPLASAVYTRMLARPLLAEMELEPGELAYDIEPHPVEAALDALAAMARTLPQGTAAAATAGRIARVRATKSGAAFMSEVERFLRSFGYLGGAENDFSAPTWAEDLPGVVRMIAERPEAPAPETKVPRQRLVDLGATSGLLRAFDRASRWRDLAARVDDAYARAYGRLRPLYLRLGDILVRRGWIDDPNDIFLLTSGALDRALSFEMSAKQVAFAIAQRAADLDYARSIAPPEVIFGEIPPEPVPADCEALTGFGAAPGYHSGETIVVDHPAEAELVSWGSIAIIPEIDGDWRAVVRRAGAVVCEAGGHTSQVAQHARALGIPCAVGVTGAAGALGSGTSVTVDGFRGTVRVVSWAQIELAPSAASQAEHA